MNILNMNDTLVFNHKTWTNFNIILNAVEGSLKTNKWFNIQFKCLTELFDKHNVSQHYPNQSVTETGTLIKS